MSNKLITNPLKKRRVMMGLTQTEVSSQLGITQSQYSRLEKSESNPTKYLVRLSKIFHCKPAELFDDSVLRDLEGDPLKFPTSNKVNFIHHENKPNEVFLDLQKGWYQIVDLENLLISISKSHSVGPTKQPKPVIRPKIRDVS